MGQEMKCPFCEGSGTYLGEIMPDGNAVGGRALLIYECVEEGCGKYFVEECEITEIQTFQASA